MGKRNTGKNTLARMIVKQLRFYTQQPYLSAKYVAFADPIKEMIRQMFPTLPRKYLYGSSKYRDEIIPGAFKDGQPLTIRQLLIDLGTKMGRNYKSTVWLDNFDYRFGRLMNHGIVVLGDERFRNEFQHLRNKDFYQIRLYRNTGAPINPTDQDISETDQDAISDDEFDCVLHNDLSLAELRQQVIQQVMPQLRDL